MFKEFDASVCAAFAADLVARGYDPHGCDFARRIVGWRVSSSLRTDLALDALESARGTLERQKKALDNQAGEARRGNALPGWLR